MLLISILAALANAGAIAVPAAELVVDRVDPPSWWAEPRSQELTLLIEGSGLEGARVTFSRESVRVDRIEAAADGHVLFVDVTIPAGIEPSPLMIEVEAGGHRARRPWEIVARPEGRPRPIGPDDVIYLIMPDRFANGDPSNDDPEGPDRMLDRRDTHAYHGGDFRGIRQKLPYLADLGVTALWLTPIYRPAPLWLVANVEGKVRRMADFHGYCPVDFYDTNPRFGSPADYRELVAEAHRLGLKVIQDQIVGYVGPRHRWVARPPSPDWFHGPIDKPPACNFRFDALTNPHATDTERRGMTDGWFFGILPDLNTRDPQVRRYTIQQSLWWTTLFGADGVRLDTYPMVERDFWRDWSRQLKRIHPEIRAVGEAWVTEPADLCVFQGGRAGWDGIDPGVDTVFDFPLYLAVTEVAVGKAPASRLARALARDGLFPRPDLLVTFLDNHDTLRLAAVPGVTPARLRLAVAFLLTTRGIPQLTWGDELAMTGYMDDRRDFPGGFPGDPRDAFTPSGRTPEEQAIFDTWRTLLHLRKSSPALRRGRLVDLAANDATYAYLREDGGERLIVVLNVTAKPASVRIPGERMGATDTAERIYGDGRAIVDAHGLTAELPGESVGVFRLGVQPSKPTP